MRWKCFSLYIKIKRALLRSISLNLKNPLTSYKKYPLIWFIFICRVKNWHILLARNVSISVYRWSKRNCLMKCTQKNFRLFLTQTLSRKWSEIVGKVQVLRKNEKTYNDFIYHHHTVLIKTYKNTNLCAFFLPLSFIIHY